MVLFVSGYPDAGLQRIFGRAWRDVGQIESWAQLLAAHGIATAVYVNDEPARDALLALQYLKRQGAGLNIDPTRIGIWSVSGNVPNALSLLASADAATGRCAVLSNGFFFGSAMVNAARQYGFVAPADDSVLASVNPALALFVIRSGREENVGLNDSLDAFVAQAVAANKSLALLNLPDAPHNFEVAYDNPATRAAIRQTIAFYQTHLCDLLGESSA